MITDSRLRYLISYVYNDFLVDNIEVDGQAFNDIQESLLELQRLRQQNAELIANSKRLAKALSNCVGIIERRTGIKSTKEQPDLVQHKELMEK